MTLSGCDPKRKANRFHNRLKLLYEIAAKRGLFRCSCFNCFFTVSRDYHFLLEGDALAAPQGRAEDVLIAATYRLSDRIGFKAGYRILEGVADNN